MSQPLTDRDVIQAIGVNTLIEHGYTEYVVRKWMQKNRGIPWHARSKIERIARQRHVPLPTSFRDEQVA